jgi:acetyl/propionyl-CoA carboxylase alpha subunit
MYKATVNGTTHDIVLGKSNTIDGQPFRWDFTTDGQGRYHIIKDHKSYNVELLEADYSTKTLRIKVNSNIYTVEISDQYDALLRQLGMDNLSSGKVNEMKAPMPGLVVDVRVTEGQELKKGDPVVVLEAMKMENILKCPADATVKKVNVGRGDKVEKNQVLVYFS